MKFSIDPCPFCGGKARITMRDIRYKENGLGEKLRQYRIRVICNRCHATGPPVTTDFINRNPYPFIRGEQESPFFRFYSGKAVEAWKKRIKETP